MTARQLSFPWAPVAREIIGRFHLDGVRPVDLEVVEVGDGAVEVIASAPPRDHAGTPWYLPHDRLVLHLRLRSDPTCTLGGHDASWNLLATEEREEGPFSSLAAWALEMACGRDWQRVASRPDEPNMAAVSHACDVAASRAVALCDTSLRDVALRFADAARFFVYRVLAIDTTGRVRQMSAACPGLIVALCALERRGRREAVADVLGGIHAGRPLRQLLHAVASALDLFPSLVAQRTDVLPPPELERLRVELLRRAPAALAPRELLLVPAAGIDVADLPSHDTDRLAWYHATLAWSSEERRAALPSAARRRLGGFVSRRGVDLAAAAAERGSDVAGVIRELVDAALESGRSVPCRRTPTARALAAVDAWHAECWAADLDEIKLLEFPPAPWTDQIPEHLTIRPIRTGAELIAEGRQMRHCVASLADQVGAGHLAIYHAVHDGEPLTVALRRCAVRWTIEEVSSFANRAPSATSIALVHTWASALASPSLASPGAIIDAT